MPAVNVTLPQLSNGGLIPPGILTAVNPDVIIPFDPTVTQVYRINRIHLEIPVYLEEGAGSEISNVVTSSTLQFNTEAERNNFINHVGGQKIAVEKLIPRKAGQALEKILEGFSWQAILGVFAGEGVEIKTERSVLPITIQVSAQLIGPEGVVWSNVFEVPLSWVQGISGTGAIDLYSDLVNPLVVFPQQAYKLRFKILVPSSVATNTQLSVYVENKEVKIGRSFATFYYIPDDRYQKRAR